MQIYIYKKVFEEGVQVIKHLEEDLIEFPAWIRERSAAHKAAAEESVRFRQEQDAWQKQFDDNRKKDEAIMREYNENQKITDAAIDNIRKSMKGKLMNSWHCTKN